MISWEDWKFVASYYTCVIDVNQKYQQSYCHNYMRWSKSCQKSSSEFNLAPRCMYISNAAFNCQMFKMAASSFII